MSIRGRVVSLERRARSGACGPGCPPRPFLLVYVNDYHDHADQRGHSREPPAPAPCPRCGRAAEPTVMRLAYVPDFFSNTERMRELNAEAPH